MTAWICSFHVVQFCTCKKKFKGTVLWDFRLQVFSWISFPPRSLCFIWFWFGLEIKECTFVISQNFIYNLLRLSLLKEEWIDFWKEIYKNLFFNIEFSQNQLSYIFIKHFHRNNSIYKITTPSYRVKKEICRPMPRNFFSSTQFQRKRKAWSSFNL